MNGFGGGMGDGWQIWIILIGIVIVIWAVITLSNSNREKWMAEDN